VPASALHGGQDPSAMNAKTDGLITQHLAGRPESSAPAERGKIKSRERRMHSDELVIWHWAR